MGDMATSDQKAGFSGAIQTLERIHNALIYVSIYRENDDVKEYYEKLKTVYMELEPFLKETKKDDEKTQASELLKEINKKMSGLVVSKRMANTKAIKEKLEEFEIFIRRHLHKYNLLMPKLSDTSAGML